MTRERIAASRYRRGRCCRWALAQQCVMQWGDLT